MLTLLAAINVSVLITSKERTAMKVCETENLLNKPQGGSSRPANIRII